MTGERNTEILNKGRAVRPRRTDRELRRFGGVMAVALVVLSLLVLWPHRPAWPYLAFAAATFAVFGLAAPRALRPIEEGWMTLAGWLSVAMTYVVLVLAYFLVITPIGLVRRLLHRDPLGLRFDKGAASYWVPVDRDGPGSRADRPF